MERREGFGVEWIGLCWVGLRVGEALMDMRCWTTVMHLEGLDLGPCPPGCSPAGLRGSQCFQKEEGLSVQDPQVARLSAAVGGDLGSGDGSSKGHYS